MRASERAYRTLLAEIQHGSLEPGTVLAESEQAARLGVSRTPAREAIGKLVSDGLAVQQSARVTVVRGFDAADIRSLFELRRALEESAAGIAAQRADRAVFVGLAAEFAAAVPEHADEAAIDAYYALIERFDTAVNDAVNNAYFTTSLRTVRSHLVRARRIARDNSERLRASVTEHRQIAEAIAAGDAALASHATHVHLHNALTSILNTLEESAS